MIRVLVVDDHARMRKSIRTLLERSGEVRVVGEAEEGKEALSQVDDLQPDVVILDISMPGMNGFEVLSALSVRDEPPHVVMLSMNDSTDLIRRALAGGAADFISKSEAGSRLLPAVRRVTKGSGGDPSPSGGQINLFGLVALLAAL